MVLTMTTTKGNANVTNFVYNYYTDGNQRTKVDTINNVTTAKKLRLHLEIKSNSDGTAVVDINSKTSGLKSQIIHFVD